MWGESRKGERMVLNTKEEPATGGGRKRRVLRREDLALDQSVLSQRKAVRDIA
jgi:hypothetical protein